MRQMFVLALALFVTGIAAMDFSSSLGLIFMVLAGLAFLGFLYIRFEPYRSTSGTISAVAAMKLRPPNAGKSSHVSETGEE